MRTITVAGFRPLAKSIHRCGGISVDSLLKELGEPATDLQSEAPMSLQLVYDLIRLAVERSSNPDIGLDAYHHLNLGTLGAPGFPLVTSPTLGIALERFAKYFPLIITGTQILIEQSPVHVKIIGLDQEIPGCPAPRAFTDSCAALQLAFIHFLAPETRPMPLTVEFPYPRPSNTERLEEVFGPHLVFGAPNLVFTFARDVLDLRLSTANPPLDTMHCEYADGQLLERVDGLQKAKVYRLVYEALTQGTLLTLENVVGTLSRSRRGLQNALKEEGTHFSAIQDDCRRELARNLLIHSPRSLKYISAQLGFREPSSFHKACVRWFNQTPGQFRNKN